MKHLLIALLVFSSGSICFAQQAKVVKVKGQQAIVQFPKGTEPYAGQMIEVGGGGGGASSDGGGDTGGGSSGGGGGGSRKNLLGVSGELSMLSQSPSGGGASVSTTSLSFAGRY